MISLNTNWSQARAFKNLIGLTDLQHRMWVFIGEWKQEAGTATPWSILSRLFWDLPHCFRAPSLTRIFSKNAAVNIKILFSGSLLTSNEKQTEILFQSGFLSLLENLSLLGILVLKSEWKGRFFLMCYEHKCRICIVQTTFLVVRGMQRCLW